MFSWRRVGFSTLQTCFHSADGGFQIYEFLQVKEGLCLKYNESQKQKVLSLNLGEGYDSWIQQKSEGKLTQLNAFQEKSPQSKTLATTHDAESKQCSRKCLHGYLRLLEGCRRVKISVYKKGIFTALI